MIFSQRYFSTKNAVEWLESRGVIVTPLNIVTALNALGLLRFEAVEHSVQSDGACPQCQVVCPVVENIKGEKVCSHCSKPRR